MKLLALLILGIAFIRTQAQTEIPKGYRPGAVVLENGSQLSGYLKDEMRSRACISFIDGKDGKHCELNGGQLRSLEIDTVRYLCMKGDFFRVVTQGRFCLLQKMSDASDKPVYNGTEAIFIYGTEGRKGDYFLFEPKQQSLRLVDHKSYVSVVNELITANNP